MVLVWVDGMMTGVKNAHTKMQIITGHGQGGTRAALASMYIKKKYNKEIPTVTFAATGFSLWKVWLYWVVFDATCSSCVQA
jgi:putative lipase involved disintegration of autophagic bodies